MRLLINKRLSVLYSAIESLRVVEDASQWRVEVRTVSGEVHRIPTASERAGCEFIEQVLCMIASTP